MRVCKGDSKAAAAIVLRGRSLSVLITFTEFARDVQTQSRAFVLCGEEWLKNMMLILNGTPGPSSRISAWVDQFLGGGISVARLGLAHVFCCYNACRFPANC